MSFAERQVSRYWTRSRSVYNKTIAVPFVYDFPLLYLAVRLHVFNRSLAAYINDMLNLQFGRDGTVPASVTPDRNTSAENLKWIELNMLKYLIKILSSSPKILKTIENIYSVIDYYIPDMYSLPANTYRKFCQWSSSIIHQLSMKSVFTRITFLF